MRPCPDINSRDKVWLTISRVSISVTIPVTVPQGHVALVLFREGDQNFYLQIPLTIIDSLCLRPRKYLLYLGWCVLGSEGTVQQGGIEIGADGNLDDQGIYNYVPNEVLSTFFSLCICCHACTLTACYLFNEDPARAVDLEVIRTRSDVASESEQACGGFRTKLLQRDVCCVWTGHNMNLGVGLHIIPYERGSEVRSTIFRVISDRLSFPSAISVVSADCVEPSEERREYNNTKEYQ
jgi:hypothetical protein